MIRLHQLCDRDDRRACIRFGFILGENRELQAEWRRSHPDWWDWEPRIASITIAPPELPVYEQPPIPAPGYIWTPGYWAYGPVGYYWVPGTWVLPPTVGLLWTPGYWGWRDGLYVWNAGYWGPHVGFYGGVNYGFGYGGHGYEGGRWNNGVFAYNQTVTNFGGVQVTNVYRETVVASTNVRVSFNGGSGGTQAQPTPQEQTVAHEPHVAPTTEQAQHQQIASTNKALLASENHGQPAIAATAKPGEFSGKGIVAARETKPSSTLLSEPHAGSITPQISATTAKTTETNPTGNKPAKANLPRAKTTEINPTGSIPAETKPTQPKATETNPSGAKALEKKEPKDDRATLVSPTTSKPLNTQTKPLVPSATSAKPNQPQPHVAAAPGPHPGVPSHPVKKPGPHPKKDTQPPG